MKSLKNIHSESVPIGTDLDIARSALEAGQLVAVPTETVYGLAGNALNEAAVSRIFAVKNRPTFDPLIIHVADKALLNKWAVDVDDRAWKLAEAFWPGPLTLLLPKADSIPDLVTAGSPRVAIRIPAHPLTLELLGELSFPLAAPSANPFGYISPTTPEHVAAQLQKGVAYILNGGSCRVGIESTIVGFEEGEVIIYRAGGLPIEKIETVVGKVSLKPHSSSNPAAPGMLKSHYAPRTPFQLGVVAELAKAFSSQEVGIIRYREYLAGIPENQQIILSAVGNLEEAARNLFSGMRALDALQLRCILAEPVPDEGLGRAINDRLRRAAAR